MSDPDIYRRLEKLERWRDEMASLEVATPIAARYVATVGQSIPNGTTATTVNFDTQSYDPLGLVATGAGWGFTCPIGGYYLVSAGVLYNLHTWTIGQVRRLDLYKNGSIWTYLDRDDADVDYGYVGGSDVVVCNAGDVLHIGTVQTSGGARTLFADGLHNYVSIAYLP